MTTKASLKLHTSGLSQDVKDAVEVFIAVAHLNSDQREHEFSAREFRRLLLISLATPHAHLEKLVLKMGRATATIRIADTSVKPNKLFLVSSIGVFEQLILTD